MEEGTQRAMSWELCVDSAERRTFKQPENDPGCIYMLLMRQGSHIVIKDLHGKHVNSYGECLMPRAASINHLCGK